MSLWPWLAVAGAGALHGLNPCNGWALAAACGRRDGRQALRALMPLAVGHAASVAVVATTVARGLLTMDALPVLAVVGGTVLALLLGCRRRGGAAGLALWSFIVTTLQGSGLMLLPALVPLCLSASPAREITASGSLGLALAAVAVHMAALLATTALLAATASNIAMRCQRGPHDTRTASNHRPDQQPHRAAGAGQLLS